MKHNMMYITAALLLTLAAACRAEAHSQSKADAGYIKKDGESVIYLAGGCFWGLESYVAAIPGVTDAVSGYANGKNGKKVTYEEVCRGGTGYKETVRVVYNPKRLSLETLLFAFFKVIDPSVTNRQGNDVGEQYQTGVFTPTKNRRK